MNTLIRRHWPLFGTIGIYLVTVITLLILSLNKNQGHLVYPLDDAYIHMAMAKNAVLHHVWGVTRYEFTSSTSSPLWTLLLAVTYLIFGVNELSPLILNVLFGTLAILVSYLFLKKNIGSRAMIFVILLFAVFAAPLPALTIAGMEHILHTLLSLCFVYLSIEVLSTFAKPPQKYYALLIILSPLVTTVRYEGTFLVFVVCVLLLFQRKVLYAITLGTVALLPVIIYGLWSISNGWYFFPNSVLLKGHVPSLSLKEIVDLLDLQTPYKTQANGHILSLLIVSLFLLLFIYRRKDKSFDGKKYANLIFVGCLLLHMQLASTGWFYRYEAYLVLLGIVVISISVNALLPEKFVWKVSDVGLPYYAALFLLILVLVNPFRYRAIGSLMVTPQAATNIYEQHYQMGLFFKRFYQGRTVAVNDIGAVCWLADIRLLDLWGLGNMETARLRLKKTYTTEQIYSIAKQQGVTIAIAYDPWFETDEIGGLPPQWVAIGKWRILNNIATAYNIVTLYAVDPSARGELVQNLMRFAKELPPDVEKYVYIPKSDVAGPPDNRL